MNLATVAEVFAPLGSGLAIISNGRLSAFSKTDQFDAAPPFAGVSRFTGKLVFVLATGPPVFPPPALCAISSM